MNVRKRTFSIVILLALSLFFFALPKIKTAHAGSLGGAIGLITGAAAFPHVPTGDTVGDIVMSTLRVAAKDVAQSMIEEMVKDTVTWINNGFHGGPGYVTNPEAYFSSIANNAAGEYIKGSDLSALCGPFSNQIKDSLKINFSIGQPNKTSPTYSCTLTGVLGNLQGFYKGFNGGWNDWFQVTQNQSNNPFGAYLEAQVSTQQYINGKVSSLSDEYKINQGFLSFKDDKGNVTTPGTLIMQGIHSQTDSGFTQLVNAKEFDDLISAFMGLLLKKTIFPQSNNEGLITNTAVTYTGGANTGGGTSLNTVSCQADGTNAVVGDPVSWSATAVVSTNNITQYIWTGDDDIVASTTNDGTINFSYKTEGLKAMKVQASTTETTVDPATGAVVWGKHTLIPDTVPVSCGGSYLVSQYPPLKLLDCRPDTLTVKPDGVVTWKATISGGSGVLSGIQFKGGQTEYPGCSSPDCSIWFPGLFTQQNLPWQYSSSPGGKPGSGGITVYSTVTNPDKTITITATRKYYGKTGGNTGVQAGDEEDTTFTVFDNDNNVAALKDVSCGSVSISP